MKGGVLIDLARRVFVKNFYLKFIAAVLALALYIWVSDDREAVQRFEVPVQITVPDEMVLVSQPIDRVHVWLHGRESDLRRLDETGIDPVHLDLREEDDDTELTITPNMIPVPPHVRVQNIEPDSMVVQLERDATDTVPVEPDITGQPRASHTVEDIRVSPEQITVRGPQSHLDQLDAVHTEPIDITGLDESLVQTVQPRVDDGMITIEHDEPITLEIDIKVEETTDTLEDVPVRGVNTTYETSVDPPVADVTVRGPKTVVEQQIDRELIRLEIDLTQEDERAPGTFSRRAEVLHLPDAAEVREMRPSRFHVTTESRNEEPVATDQTDDDDPDGEPDEGDL